jgi:hypothetical protein
LPKIAVHAIVGSFTAGIPPIARASLGYRS